MTVALTAICAPSSSARSVEVNFGMQRAMQAELYLKEEFPTAVLHHSGCETCCTGAFARGVHRDGRLHLAGAVCNI